MKLSQLIHQLVEIMDLAESGDDKVYMTLFGENNLPLTKEVETVEIQTGNNNNEQIIIVLT